MLCSWCGRYYDAIREIDAYASSDVGRGTGYPQKCKPCYERY
jgi:hypothetical protein